MKSMTYVKCFVLAALLSMMCAVKLEKTETVYEFLNNLIASSVSSETEKLGSELLNTNIDAAKNATSPAAVVVDEMTQLWLRISSPYFKDKNKFPPIVLPGGEQVIVRVDTNNFRINDAFESNSKDQNLPSNPLDFWFRLVKDKLYYARTKNGHDVLGSISFTDAKKDVDGSKYCVKVNDHSDVWLVCADNDQKRMNILCQIRKNLGKVTDECLNVSQTKETANTGPEEAPKTQPTVIEDKVFQPIILIPLPSRKCNDNWDYRSKGSDWECTCKTGVEQSPIDLPEMMNAHSSPVSPLFQYEEVSARSTITTIDGELKAEEFIKIKHFKNALRIFHSNFGKIVTLDGAVYIAEEIVFHTPAEHTISGRRFDMEMQIIHYGQSKGDISKQVVLSFMFERKPGVYNKFMDDIDFFSLPNSEYTEKEIINNLFIPKVFYSTTDEQIPVMKPFSFYTYQGSITFPPCTERTIHYVASKPIPIGSAPLQLLKEAIKIPDKKNEQTGDVIVSNDDGTNFRQTQPINGRAVFFYDHKRYCETKDEEEEQKEVKPKKVKFDGHYEKIKRQVTEFIYVTGNEPTGLPNAFVISEKEAKGDSPSIDIKKFN